MVSAALQYLGEESFDAPRAPGGWGVEEEELRLGRRCRGLGDRAGGERLLVTPVSAHRFVRRGSSLTATLALSPSFSTTMKPSWRSITCSTAAIS